MAKSQSAMLDRKKLMADPIMVLTIVVLITFLTLFILYPLAILLVDSFYGGNGFTLATFQRIMAMPNFITAITNTLKVGFLVGILSTIVGLLFAYVEVYVRVGKAVGGLFKVVSMLPVVSPPFVLSLSMIMLFGKAGIITRQWLKIYDNSVYGFWGIVIVQTLTFFPVCYMMLKGLLKNIDPSLEEAARDMGASRWKVFATVTFPLLLPGLGNAFLVTFIESIADFANPMIIGGSYDTLATTIYLQITGAYDKEGAAAMAVVLLFFGVLFAGLSIAERSDDEIGTMVAGGCTVMLVFQAFLNIACVIGVFPTTGKPLPFISAGGSSMLASFILLGLILSVSRPERGPSVYEQRRADLRLVRQERPEEGRPRPSRGAGRPDRPGRTGRPDHPSGSRSSDRGRRPAPSGTAPSPRSRSFRR